MTSENANKISMEKLLPIINESIRDGGQFVFYPSGTSMLPTIIPGEDCVVLVQATNLKKYDLVLFSRVGGSHVLHRIMSMKNGQYIISGDNQTWTETITGELIIAKVSEIRKKNGAILTLTHFSSFSKIMWLKAKKLKGNILGKLRSYIGKKKK